MTDLAPRIAAAFSQVFGREVGADADFFELGGDSLAAEDLLTLLSACLDMDLPGWLLLDHPTPKALARVIADSARG